MVIAMAVAVARPVVISAMAVTVAARVPVVTGPMPVAAIAVAPIVMTPVVAVTVMNQGRDPGDQRHDDAMTMVSVCRGARRGQYEQTGGGYQLQFVYAVLNH